MAKDIIITPASGKIDFLDNSVSKASLTLDSNNDLQISNGTSPATFNTTTAGASVLKVTGTNGTLFEITDDLSSSLMSVNTIAGLPVLEVFSDYHIVAGRYNQNDFYLNTNGNLGLGTASPSQLLQIVATNAANNGITLQNTNSSGNSQVRFLNTSGSERAAITYINSSDAVYHYTSAGGNLLNLVGANVGIGTASPTAKLHVNGTFVSNAIWTDSSSITYWGGYASAFGGLTWNTGMARVFANTGNRLELAANLNVVGVAIDTSGNVGIGTSNPVYNLDIVGSGGADDRVFLRVKSNASSGDGDAILYLDSAQIGESDIDFMHDGSLNWRIRTGDAAGSTNTNLNIQNASSNNVLTLEQGGFVGVGTNNPERNLHVFKGESSGAAANSDSTLVLENSSHTYVQFLTPTTSESGLLFGDSDNDRGALTYNHNTDSMNFRIAANTRMFINSSGNVGIGQTSPVTKLHIAVNNSSVHAPTAYTNNGVKALTLRTQEGDGLEWHLAHSTNGYTGWVAAARVNNTGGNWGNGYLEFTTASSSSGAGNANVLVLTGTGNVGIGTASTSQKLHVSGNSLVTGNTYIGDTNRYFQSSSNGVQFQTAHGYIFLGPDNASWAHIQTDRSSFYFNKSLAINGGMVQSYDENLVLNAAVDAARAIEFRSGGTTYMYMTAGSLGIGTTSPGSILSVVGTTGINVSPGASGTYGSSSAINNLISLTMPYGSSAATTSNAGARVGIAFRGATSDPNPSSDNNKTAAIYGVSEDTGAGYSRKMGLALYTSSFDATASERVRIDADGNVGIGTTSPARKLDLTAAGQITFGDGVTGDYNQGIYWNSGSGYGIYKTSGAWSSPNYQQLQINWDTGIVLNPGSGNYGKSHVGVQGGLSVGDSYYTTMEDNGLIVQGSVGIGTTSPSYRLQVVGNSYFAAEQTIQYTNAIQTLRGNTGYSLIRLYGNSNAVELQMDAHRSSGAGSIGTFSNSDLYFKTNDTTRAAILSGGSVGIGTTSPSTQTHIYGTLTVDSSGNSTNSYTEGIRLGASSNGYSIVTFGANASASSGSQANQWWIGRYGGTNHFNFYNPTGGNVVNIKLDGNVGIGTTSASVKLHVAVNTTNSQFRLTRTGTATGEFDIYTNSDTLYFKNVGGGNTIPLSVDQNVYATNKVAIKTTTLAGSNNFHVSSGTTGSASKSSIAVVSVADNSTFSGGTAALHVINSGNRGTTGHGSGSDLLRLEFSDGIHTLFDKDGNVGIGTTTASSTLHVVDGTSGASVLTVDGTNGTLFSVVDDLSDSLMSVNDAAGLPVLEVFADSHIVAGRYGQNDFYLDTNGNLGLGTASPTSAKLEVRGRQYNLHTVADETVLHLYNSSTSGYGTYIRVDNSDVSRYALRIDNGGSQNLTVPNSGGLILANLTDNVDQVKITRAGYSTTHADAKLYIYDNSNADWAQKISLDGYSYGLRIDGFTTHGLELIHTSLGTVFVTTSSELVVNQAGANYDFRVQGDTDTSLLVCDASADRVGIGTSSPSQKLHVVGGNIHVGSSGSSFLVSNGYGYFQDYSSYGARLGRISFINMNSGGSNWDNYAYHGIGSTDASANFGDSISINSYNDITLRLDSNNNNSASYFRIMNNTTGNNIISYIGFDGTYSTAQLPSFVGVNSGPTTSYNLNVNGSVNATTYYGNGSNLTSVNADTVDGYQAANLQKIYTGTVTFQNSYVNAFKVTGGSSLSSAIRVRVSGTSGNVVVTSILDIVVCHSADISITSQSGNYTELTVKVTSDNNQNYDVAFKHNGSTSTSVGLQVLTYNNESITFTSSTTYSSTSLEHVAKVGSLSTSSTGGTGLTVQDNVGIGTTNPSQKLHVIGNTYIAGNLGIGTSSPTGNLHIQKSTAGALFESSGSTNYTGITYLGDTSNNFWSSSLILNNANGIFEIRNNSSSAAIAINTSGNVGINTTSPTQKLHVNGNVTATAYYGDGSNLTGISTSSSSNTQSQKSGTTTLTLNVGSYALHVVPLANGTTISSITYSSAPSSGTVSSIIVILKYSGTATVTWTNVIWSGGVTPTLTGSSGKGDVFSLTSYNGGSNWIGAVVAQNLDSTNL